MPSQKPINITVESTIPLTDIQLQELQKILKKKLSQPITLTNTTNSLLLGGLRLKIDQEYLDLSLKQKVQQLEQYLSL